MKIIFLMSILFNINCAGIDNSIDIIDGGTDLINAPDLTPSYSCQRRGLLCDSDADCCPIWQGREGHMICSNIDQCVRGQYGHNYCAFVLPNQLCEKNYQ